ncbi:hypothetical protein D1007_35673 [Hordeum vulgare]|nr:hypothetical protein D1007_35673 [Hordeum vulgare]
MDDDLEAAAGLASLASSGVTPAGRGKPRAPARPPVSKKKKELTPEERAVESTKRKDRRHAQDARGEAVAVVAIAVAAHEKDTNARVKAVARDALLYLGVNPSQHGLVNADVAAVVASTGSSAYPWMMRSKSPRTSSTQPIPGFHIYPQGSHFSEECLLEVSIVAPSTPASMTIDLNATSVAGGSSSGGTRKRQREMLVDTLTVNRFLENMIFETVHRRLVVGLDGFPLDHEFPEDYDLEEEEIEAANAKTKAKEVALTSMKTCVEIMNVDVNTVSPRKRLWFEKMQTEMLKFDQL